MPKGKKNRQDAASSEKGGKNDTRNPVAADCAANENKEINNRTISPTAYKPPASIKMEPALHLIDERPITGGTGSIGAVVSSFTLPCAMKN
jgi:hypothetical protein